MQIQNIDINKPMIFRDEHGNQDSFYVHSIVDMDEGFIAFRGFNFTDLAYLNPEIDVSNEYIEILNDSMFIVNYIIETGKAIGDDVEFLELNNIDDEELEKIPPSIRSLLEI